MRRHNPPGPRGKHGGGAPTGGVRCAWGRSAPPGATSETGHGSAESTGTTATDAHGGGGPAAARAAAPCQHNGPGGADRAAAQPGPSHRGGRHASRVPELGQDHRSVRPERGAGHAQPAGGSGAGRAPARNVHAGVPGHSGLRRQPRPPDGARGAGVGDRHVADGHRRRPDPRPVRGPRGGDPGGDLWRVPRGHQCAALGRCSACSTAPTG